MLVYRIARSNQITDLTGMGSKLYGGRWNHRGTAVIYTSESRSLATVEYLVHASLPHVPSGLSIATIEIPDDLVPEEVLPRSLPKGWRNYPAPPRLADLGTQWVRSKRCLLLRVPSTVVEQEHNILVNPFHPGMVHVVLLKVESYELDQRLFR